MHLYPLFTSQCLVITSFLKCCYANYPKFYWALTCTMKISRVVFRLWELKIISLLYLSFSSLNFSISMCPCSFSKHLPTCGLLSCVTLFWAATLILFFTLNYNSCDYFCLIAMVIIIMYHNQFSNKPGKESNWFWKEWMKYPYRHDVEMESRGSFFVVCLFFFVFVIVVVFLSKFIKL